MSLKPIDRERIWATLSHSKARDPPRPFGTQPLDLEARPSSSLRIVSLEDDSQYEIVSRTWED